MQFLVTNGKGSVHEKEQRHPNGYVPGVGQQRRKTGRILMITSTKSSILQVLMQKAGLNRQKKWGQSILFLQQSIMMDLPCGHLSLPIILSRKAHIKKIS